MYAKNQVGQTLFENFDFLVKVKGQTWSKLFFSGGSDRVTDSGQVQGTGSSWKWEVTSSWRHRAGGARVSAWGIMETRGRPKSARVSAWNDAGDQQTFWWRMEARGSHLGPKFLGFVDMGPVDLLVLSVFWNLEHICIGLKEEAAISKACSHAWRRVLAPVILIFQGFINWSPFKVLVGSVLWNDLRIFTNLEEKVVGDNLSMMTFLFFFSWAALTRRRLCLDLRVRR